MVRYILSKKGELKILDLLANLLSAKIYYIKSYDGNNMVVNLNKCKYIIDYLKLYP
jgi:hypothetical protein